MSRSALSHSRHPCVYKIFIHLPQKLHGKAGKFLSPETRSAMELYMETESRPAKCTLANTHAPSNIPESEAVDLATLTLDDQGVIRDCCRACEPVFGYLPDQLIGRHISVLLPQLPNADLVQEGRINARLAFLCHCAFAFQARHRDGQIFASELFINRLDTHNVVVLVRNLDRSKSMGIYALKPVH